MIRLPASPPTQRIIIGVMAAAIAGTAQATRQCPAQFGSKPAWVNASGWLLLAAFLLAGVACVPVAWKATRGRSRFARIGWMALSLVAMPALWLLGIWLAWTQFFLRC